MQAVAFQAKQGRSEDLLYEYKNEAACRVPKL